MASAALSHLSHETRTQAQLDDKARIELIKRDRWIDYPRATDAMNRLGAWAAETRVVTNNGV